MKAKETSAVLRFGKFKPMIASVKAETIVCLGLVNVVTEPIKISNLRV